MCVFKKKYVSSHAQIKKEVKYLLSILFIVSTVTMHGQDVRVSVESPRVVRVGAPFQIMVQVNADATNIRLPELNAFTIVSNRGRSQSTSVSIINGRMTQSVHVNFNYFLQANQEGTHEIGEVEVTVGGNTYRSTPVTIQVVAGNASTQQQQGTGGSTATQPQTNNQQPQSNSRDLFVEVIPDRRQVYQGEYLNVSLKLFSQLQVRAINNIDFPTFDGFFRHEVETPPLRALNQEEINGTAYLTGVFRQYVLFPQRSGTLTISQCNMEVVVNQRVQGQSRSLIDEFFGRMQATTRQATSRPVTITVLPLPEGKPASFSGGVGQMRFAVTVDKTDVKANEAVMLKATVSGNGNMRFVDAPRINFPPDFELYDPQISTQLNAANTTGSKTFEYLVIPRHGGTFKIPSVEFSYFDPQAREYRTLLSEELTITVERGDELPGATIMSGITREDIRHIGRDISYIKTGTIKLHRAGDYFFGTWMFWMWYIVPLTGFTVTVFLRRKYIRKYADVAMVKNRRANRYATRRLKKARKLKDNGMKEQFYEELSRALWGYLSDKLTIPVAELSIDNATTIMEQRNVNATLSKEFTSVIDDCEFARYAPSTTESDMDTLYNNAVEVINRMQRVV